MRVGMIAALLMLAFPAYGEPPFALTVGGIETGKPIAEKFAFCTADPATKTKNGGNISPMLSWTKGPKGTKSYAVIMFDPDVPTVFDDANKKGKTIAADLPRQNFYHWLLVDIPASFTKLPEGVESNGVDKDGKPAGKQPHGVRGLNDYGSFMKGQFGGYDGPCPPWNDERLHHYHFTVYALSEPSLKLPDGFNGKQAVEAIKPHILAQSTVVGTYTQNPSVLTQE